MELYPHVKKQDKEVYKALIGEEKRQAEGLELITARDLAEARILGGRDHPVSQEWSLVVEHLIYLSNKRADILVVDGAHSQLLAHPVEATAAPKRWPKPAWQTRMPDGASELNFGRFLRAGRDGFTPQGKLW